MEYRRIGRSGLKVSALSLGGQFHTQKYLSQQEFESQVFHALEHGVNLIDLADLYGQGEVEAAYGRLFSHYPRHQLVLSSKCFWPLSQGINHRGLSRKHIVESVNQSLNRLNTDYLDLYICQHFDSETPLEETVWL